MSARTLSIDAAVRLRGKGAAFELDVELEVPPGITVLMGTSGSGKSTLLQTIAGLIVPDRGRIVLGDEQWFDRDKNVNLEVHRRKVAFVFQSLALFPHLSAIANVAYGIDRAVPRAERSTRAHKLLERLAVTHVADRKPATYSGGEAQRVALARALASEPQILLLDEPFSALDQELRRQMVDLVKNLIEDYPIPVLQVTHAHDEARRFGGHIVVLDKGRVARTGPADVVLS